MQTEMSNSIEAIVDAFCRNNPDKVLCISLDARLEYKEYHVSRGIQFAISAPDNYVKVVMAVEDKIAL
jgi:hypothetical protein